MIKKLRWRVARYTIIAVALVLITLMAIINIANFISRDRSSAEMLNMLLDNDGHFPGRDGQEMGHRPKGNQGTSPWADLYDDDFDNPMDEDFRHLVTGGPNNMTAETPYETRFFSVVVADDGSVSNVDIGQIAAVSNETAREIAEDVYSKEKESGYRGRYKFASKDADSGRLYVFLDCSRSLESVRSFLQTSVIVSLVGLILIAALIIVLSPRMVKPIAESYEKQKQFISDAGHELKTPLAVIGSCTEVLEMEAGANKWTEGIRDQVERMGELTHELISLARMDGDEATMVMAQVDLSSIAKDAADPFTLLAEQKNLKLNLNIENDISIKGNGNALRELITILLDNAVKYAAGEEIDFSLNRSGKHILIETHNSANGLTSGKQNQFFERFYRGDSSRTKGKTSGYGIGLSMAKSIVNIHGGTIDAHSPDGKELVVTVKL